MLKTVAQVVGFILPPSTTLSGWIDNKDSSP